MQKKIKSPFKFKKKVPNIDRFLNYLKSNPITFKILVDDSYKDFFKNLEINFDLEKYMSLYTMYLLMFYRDKSKLNLIEKYVKSHTALLTETEKKLFNNFIKGIYSCFQVIKISKNKSITLRDIFTDKIYFVEEEKGSQLLKIGEIIFTFIFQSIEDQKIYLNYGDFYVTNMSQLNLDNQSFLNIKEKKLWTPKSTLEFVYSLDKIDKPKNILV